jgi:hypothetical protein
MATQEELEQAVEDCLKQIGKESKIVFSRYLTPTYTQGGYSAGDWTYNFTQQRVSLEYWFSAFSSRKEEIEATYPADDNKEKLESDLRAIFGKLHQTVKRKKGLF